MSRLLSSTIPDKSVAALVLASNLIVKLQLQKDTAFKCTIVAEEKEREQLVIEDWMYDTNNTEILTRANLFHCLFEMGDMWTPSINAME